MANEEQAAQSSKVHVMKMKKFKKIPTFIVEEHNQVLELLLPALANNYLPFQNNLMIHFDSHPDLCAPRNMKASTIFNRNELLESLSIENWLLPMINFINEIVWIHPSFAAQIPDGVHEFSVGDFDEKICVSSSLDYFLSDGSYCAEDKINNKKLLKLYVKQIEENMNEMIGDRKWILDIDLDFFSTHNPFKNIYPLANTYEKLKEIFYIEKNYDLNDPESIEAYVKKKNYHLDFFETIFQHLAQQGSLDKYKMNDENMRAKFELTKELVECLCRNYSIYDIDWFVINDAGCTTDEEKYELPHHESTHEEIREAIKKFELFLRNIKSKPEIVTIARSSTDGYTPASQVELIQELVLETLRKVYAENLTETPTLWYKNSSDVPALELVEPRMRRQKL